MSSSNRVFDPLDAASQLHFMLATRLRRERLALDLVYHGTSGVITVFEPAVWVNLGAGRGREICDIFPTRRDSWFVEWRDGKTYHGSGGALAFVEVLMRGIRVNLKEK
ncbi:MAG: hypothetical protein AAF903_04090 [Pseudomonadota bacterium]